MFISSPNSHEKNVKKLLLLFIIFDALLLAWYFLSPLFLNQTVNEAFPVTSKESEPVLNPNDLTQAEIDAMNEEEKAKMEQEMLKEWVGQSTVMHEDLTQEQGSIMEPIAITSGTFENADDFHKGSGLATVYKLADGSHVLRLEDFEVTNGPDLRVYLVESLSPTKEEVKKGLELAALKGNVGDQNYQLPANVDPADYGSVVIYCKPFGVIFSVAGLR